MPSVTQRGDNPFRAGCSSWTDLDEPGGAEIVVKGERLVDPAAAHDGEAGRIDEGVLPLVMLTEPAPGIGLERGVDVDDFDTWQSREAVDESNCRRMPGTAAQQRPRLAVDVVVVQPADHGGPGILRR